MRQKLHSPTCRQPQNKIHPHSPCDSNGYEEYQVYSTRFPELDLEFTVLHQFKDEKMNKKLALLLCCSALFAACTDDSAGSVNCTNGEAECVNNVLRICDNNAWLEAQCLATQVCDATAKTCAPIGDTTQECQNGDVECDNLTLKICENGAWNITQCDAATQVCSVNDKKCMSNADYECDAGTITCSSDLKQYQVCSADNRWVVEKECSATETCNAAAGGCVPLVCTEGAAECDANTLKLCNDNAWTSTPCAADLTCNANAKACTCEEGKTVCENDVLKICGNNTWATQDCKADNMICNAETKQCELPAADGKYTSVKAIHNDFAKFVDIATCATNEVADPKAKEASVVIEGVITAVRSSKQGFYIQEPSADGKHAGIYVHCPGSKDNDTRNWKDCAESLNVGDNVRVTGDSIGNVRCQIEIYQLNTPVKVEKTNKTDKIDPIVLTAADVTNNNDLNNPYNGTLAIVKGLTTKEKTGTDGWMMEDANGNPIKLQYWLALAGMNQIISVGKKFDVTGIVSNFKVTGIQPRSTDDMKEIK